MIQRNYNGYSRNHFDILITWLAFQRGYLQTVSPTRDKLRSIEKQARQGFVSQCVENTNTLTMLRYSYLLLSMNAHIHHWLEWVYIAVRLLLLHVGIVILPTVRR